AGAEGLEADALPAGRRAVQLIAAQEGRLIDGDAGRSTDQPQARADRGVVAERRACARDRADDSVARADTDRGASGGSRPREGEATTQRADADRVRGAAAGEGAVGDQRARGRSRIVVLNGRGAAVGVAVVAAVDDQL